MIQCKVCKQLRRLFTCSCVDTYRAPMSHRREPLKNRLRRAVYGLYEGGQLGHLAKSTLTIVVYYFFSISITFYNRYLFLTYKYPLSITIMHLIFKFLMASLIRTILNVFSKQKRITLDWSTYLHRICTTGAASAADIGCSNWSLQYITVSLYTMSKSTVILFIFFFSLLLKLEKWRSSMIVVVLCISTGLFLFTFHSTEFHIFGFVLVMIASFSAGLRWTLTQALTQKHKLGLSNPIDMMYFIQPGMILCLIPLAVYVEGVTVVTTDKFFRSDDMYKVLNHLLWIGLGALLAFFLESSELLLVSYTSSLTLSVSGIFKEICIIYLAVIWNHNQLNTLNGCGLIICLIGIIIHVGMKVSHELELAKVKSYEVQVATMSSDRLPLRSMMDSGEDSIDSDVDLFISSATPGATTSTSSDLKYSTIQTNKQSNSSGKKFRSNSYQTRNIAEDTRSLISHEDGNEDHF